MARASTVTWLPIDVYARIMGIHPAFFNGVTSTTFADTDGCSSIWYQWPWQSHGRVGREDLAVAISAAERAMADYLGYHLLPDWVRDERRPVTRPYRRDLFDLYGYNARGLGKSVKTGRAWIISGGIRAKTVIQAGAQGTASDADNDGYSETVTFTVTTTVDPSEVRLYHTGKSATDDWEIRPITVVDNGATLTITCKIWQLVDPDLWDRMDAGSHGAIDGDTVANFQQCAGPIICADVYRVYNDPQQQCYMLWEEPQCSTCGGSGCTACEQGTQTACTTVRDARLGILTYAAAEWDATNSHFDAAIYDEWREPDKLRLWYFSGWQWDSASAQGRRAYHDMDPVLERAVAYYATALLSQPLCECDCHRGMVDYWREDLALTNQTRSYQNGQRVIDNPFGTTRGALYAWDVCNHEGRKVAR